MSTQELYQETISWMKDQLQQTINDFSGAYDVAYNHYHAKPLFSITSQELELLKSVDHFSKYQTRNALVQLCRQVAVEFGHNVVDCTKSSDVDFYELCDGNKIGYYVSMHPMDMPNLEQAIADGLTEHIVIVAESSLINLPNASHKYREYPYKEITRCITLEEFFNCVAPGEFEVFQEYIGRFNYDAEMMLGLIVSPIPTQRAIQEKREKVVAEFESFFYKTSLPSAFTSDEIDFLKDRFRQKDILGKISASFIDSLVSSEWYYDLLVSTDGEMEQTAIVAGYLKAIEQFLFALMLSRCDELQFKLKDQKNKNLVILTKDNKSDLLSMANNLLVCIDKNYGKALHKVYVNEIIGDAVQTFLRDFFTRTRNGYFHKDNIYSFEEIKTIRERTYCAFFLLGSSFEFDVAKLKSVI